MKKTVLAVSFAAALLLALVLPGLAAEEPVTVYVSVFDGKTLALSHCAVELTDADGDGGLTVNDALLLAHREHCPGGYASENTAYGLSMTKLWGVGNGGAYGYYVNNTVVSSLAQTLLSGDAVYAFAYADTVTYSDTYCYFDREELTEAPGTEASLTLTSLSFDASFAPVLSPVAGAKITFNGEATEYVTDENGAVTLTVPENNTLISATGEGANLLPPVCVCRSGALPTSEQTLFRLSGGDTQTYLSETLAQSAGDASDFAVFALLKSAPELDYSAYAKALYEVFEKSGSAAPATRLRSGLLLCKMGIETDTEALLSETENTGGVMARIFALLLRNAAGLPTEEALQSLLALQLPDGGWTVTGQTGECDATAFALQAIAPYPEATENADKALAFLQGIQNPEGDFTSYGTPNSEACAQVLMALCALKKEGEPFGISVKNALLSYRNEAGGFSHTKGGEENLLSTIEAYCALCCAETGDGLYDSSPVCVSLSRTPGYKVWGTAAIAALCLLSCGILLIKKRKRDAILCLALSVLLTGGLWLSDFQSVSEHHTATKLTDPVGTATISITGDGSAILAGTEAEIGQGETAYTLLVRIARENDIDISVKGSGATAYIQGIDGLFELDKGATSGWVYLVNGVQPDRGAGAYILSDGDRVEWRYSLENGRDIT